jgi:RNA recognition motif-containing protein
MKLLVRNLAPSTSKSALEKLFSQHGTLQSCVLVLDDETGQSKGFGFVTMQSVGEAKAAMKSLNGMKLHGYEIRVKKAVAKKGGEPTNAPSESDDVKNG